MCTVWFSLHWTEQKQAILLHYYANHTIQGDSIKLAQWDKIIYEIIQLFKVVIAGKDDAFVKKSRKIDFALLSFCDESSSDKMREETDKADMLAPEQSLINWVPKSPKRKSTETTTSMKFNHGGLKSSQRKLVLCRFRGFPENGCSLNFST